MAKLAIAVETKTYAASGRLIHELLLTLGLFALLVVQD